MAGVEQPARKFDVAHEVEFRAQVALHEVHVRVRIEQKHRRHQAVPLLFLLQHPRTKPNQFLKGACPHGCIGVLRHQVLCRSDAVRLEDVEQVPGAGARAGVVADDHVHDGETEVVQQAERGVEHYGLGRVRAHERGIDHLIAQLRLVRCGADGGDIGPRCHTRVLSRELRVDQRRCNGRPAGVAVEKRVRKAHGPRRATEFCAALVNLARVNENDLEVLQCAVGPCVDDHAVRESQHGHLEHDDPLPQTRYDIPGGLVLADPIAADGQVHADEGVAAGHRHAGIGVHELRERRVQGEAERGVGEAANAIDALALIKLHGHQHLVLALNDIDLL
mmetsp:Transcript_92833/g.267016  ORF Transcript_92833/g.267016 Transcript_92833/m.267016 type:complete len:334 (-) Transcript_92833:200-1201(-)